MVSSVWSIGRKLSPYILLLGLLVTALIFTTNSAHAVAGVNQQLNFQGRLLNSQGATVPDGYYNIQFKIYQDGDGLTAGNTTGSPAGSLKWTEDYLNANSQGVAVINGFMSVQLGSITPFGSSIDWNQDTLWLSMNIGGTGASCTPFSACSPDGEMVPMKRLSANAYALNSSLLGGLSSANFVQFAQGGVQTDSTSNTSIALNKTGSGNIIELQSSGNAAFTINNSGDIAFGNNANHTISVATAASGAGNSLTVSAGNAAGASALAGGNLILSGGAGDGSASSGSVIVRSNINNSVNAFQVQNASSASVFGVNTVDGIVQVGSATANTDQNLLVLNNYSSATDPTNGTNGAMYYNTSTDSFRCFVGGAWSDCSGAHGSFIDLQALTPGTVQTGNFNIDGTGIASTLQGTTSVLTPLIDTASATTLNIGTSNATNLQIGNIALSSGTQNIGIGNNNTAGGTTNVTIGSGALATAGTTALQAKTAITLSTDGIARGTFDNAGNLYLGNGVTATAPSNFTVSGTDSTATAVAGGAITIQGGNATTGNANGGNLILSGGNGVGTGSNGLVVLSTPTFSTTTNDPNCFTGGALVTASCTIADSSVNNSAAIFAGFSTTGKTVTLPDPANTTAGRIIYLTAANGSQDFTLLVNGGGTGNSIAMRQNTSATMIWNGTDWTAAGASSSTTLQSAYDNTLQSAGGAELVVSHTANTNGLTIRDSSVDPVNGTLLSVQTASAAVLLSVNSNVTEYSTNGGAEVAGGSSSTFPASTWSNNGSSTVSRYTTAGDYIATGKAAVSVVTTASAGAGVKNTLSTSLTANTNYNVSFATRLASGTFTDMDVYYSANGTATSVACKTNQAVATSIWTKVNCTFAAPASGINSSNAILIRQTSGSAHTFYVDNLSVTIAADYNYATDPGVDDNINFATNWSAVSGASVSRTTSYGNDASDSAQVITTGSGQGIRNKLAINPLTSTLYRVSVYAASTTSGFNNFTVRYSRDGGTNFVNCADYNTQTVSSSTSNFTQITCYITTDGTAATNPYVYFTQTDGTGRTFFVDTLSVTLSSNTTPNVQIGGGVTGGPVTLLTLDKGASAPIASNNDALLGSMYYDTTLGKLQCYEADGWGACGSSPDNIVTISPEYTNAVLHGTGVGTMTSDICSDALNINDGSSGQDTICGPNETFNFYKWTSPQATDQTYSIYITYQLPGTFKSFASGQTSIMGRTDSANSSVTYQVYRNDPTTGLSPCGSAVAVSSGAVSSWQTGVASGAADPSTCGFAPGNSLVLKITMTAKQNADAYVSNLNFIFSNR